MPTSLFQYEMLPTTWFYLSSLMIIAIFFKFNRFWSLRNLDIAALILLTPGLLYIAMGQQFFGFLWLTGIGLWILIRLILDTVIVRRPLLEPNLSPAGLTFACIALVAFLIPNLFINRGENVETTGTLRMEQILPFITPLKTGELLNEETRTDNLSEFSEMSKFSEASEFSETSEHSNISLPTKARYSTPGYPPFIALTQSMAMSIAPTSPEVLKRIESVAHNSPIREIKPDLHSSSIGSSDALESEKDTIILDSRRITSEISSPNDESELIKKNRPFFPVIFVVLAQIALVFGMVFIGHCHFDNIRTGIAAAMVYLLHPYTNQFPGSIDHILPAALLIWAIAMYRRPMISGILLGIAGTLVFYPFFLIPLWAGFYWKRGVNRFLLGIFSAVLVMGLLLLFSPEAYGTFGEQLINTLGHRVFRPYFYQGIWEYLPTFYRIPVIAVFLVFFVGLFFWPHQKNLATLIAGSTLLMLGVQYWQGICGGLYMAWFLPLFILTVFRPNLEDRIAQSTVIEI